jgi:hypothetical protein
MSTPLRRKQGRGRIAALILNLHAVKASDYITPWSLYPQGIAQAAIEPEAGCGWKIVWSFEEEKNNFHLSGIYLLTVQHRPNYLISEHSKFGWQQSLYTQIIYKRDSLLVAHRISIDTARHRAALSSNK